MTAPSVFLPWLAAMGIATAGSVYGVAESWVLVQDFPWALDGASLWLAFLLVLRFSLVVVIVYGGRMMWRALAAQGRAPWRCERCRSWGTPTQPRKVWEEVVLHWGSFIDGDYEHRAMQWRTRWLCDCCHAEAMLRGETDVATMSLDA